MTTIILYLTTFAVFLCVDAIGLRLLLRPLFERHIGAMMLDDIRLIPAVGFYAFYIAGLLWFVSIPALRDQTGLMTVFATGVLFGAIGYGVYEFTNFATLKGWTLSMVAADLTWGAVVTGCAAVAGVSITRAVSG